MLIIYTFYGVNIYPNKNNYYLVKYLVKYY